MPKKKEEKSEEGIIEEKKVEQKNDDVVSFDFFIKLKESIVSPKKFLNRVEGEKRYQPILRDFILFYLLLSIIGIGVAYYQNLINVYQVMLSFIFSILNGLVVIFGTSFITHLGVKMFKGKEGYFNTYKPIAYGLMIWIAYSLISLLFVQIVPFDSSVFLGLQEASSPDQVLNLYKTYFQQPGAIVNLIIGLIAFIHLFIFMVLGISKFQKISIGKTIGSIIIPWIIFIIVFIGIIILVGLASDPTLGVGF